MFQFTIPGYSPSLWKDQGRNLKQLVTSHTRAEGNKHKHARLLACLLILNSVSPLLERPPA